MADSNENIFTFDTTPFSNGLKKITDGITSVQNKAANMAKDVSKGMVNAAMKIGLAALSFKGIKAAIAEMPEIGQAWGIAKGIITKNLLYPLRQAVFPLLQDFLNWVRDNRAMFVKWGGTLANIFNVVVGKVKQIIEFGSRLGNVFKDLINKTFGMQIRNFEDFINILSFKFAVLAEFISGVLGQFFSMNKDGNSLFTVLEGVAGLFGKILDFGGKITSSFLSGFLSSIKDIATPLQRIVNSVTTIFDKLFGGTTQLKIWQDVFKWLGEFLGGSFMATLETIAGLIAAMADGLSYLMELPEKIKKGVENSDKAPEVWVPKGKPSNQFGGSMFNQGDVKGPYNDVIITKRGDIVPVSPDDNILAFKGGGKDSSQKIDISIDFSGMQLVLQQASPDEARRFAGNMVDALRQQLTSELERKGLK